MRRTRRTANDLGVRLRSLREREGISLGTLSYMLGLPRAVLERIEIGQCADDAAIQRVRRWIDGAPRGPERDASPCLLPRKDASR